MKTYVFDIEIEQEEDGTWFAQVPTIPGCALSCYPREHVLDSLQEAAQMMLEIAVEYGDPLPEGIETYEVGHNGIENANGEVVTVSI